MREDTHAIYTRGNAMELREYLSIRRAFNLVRQRMDSASRLTFFELAILCRLDVEGGPLNTSQIAEHQGSLRPTMTHRTKHLSDLGLLDRSQGTEDRRNVVCSITDEGQAFVDETCQLICNELRGGNVLSRTTPRRICRYVDAMGSLGYMSGSLVLLGIEVSGRGWSTVSDLVATLGLLQPTVSMSVSALERDGMVRRVKIEDHSSRSAPMELTEAGKETVDQIVDEIHALVVHRDAMSSHRG